MHLTNESDSLVLGEVVQHLRGNDEVECLRRKRKCQRVAGDSSDREFPRRTNEFNASVEPEHIEGNPVLTSELPESVRNVPSPGAHIEERSLASHLTKPGCQLGLNGVDTTEEPVRKRDIAMRAALQRRIASFIEILHPPTSRWREDRHR